MRGRIYLRNQSKELVAMTEVQYDSEALLQGLLAEHPDLLAGDQMDDADPRRLVLVKREMGIPGEAEGSSRWSVDHLFLDQDGIPTLVEVKRGTDARVRREVVGQMLDYAANAVLHWPIEEIRAGFGARCQQAGIDPDEELAELLGDDRGAGDFWQDVKLNLQAGRIRILFVSDTIPSELRRIVEFLNQQMDPAEVLAVEVKQFRGEKLETFVPRLIGQTESARQKKGMRSPGMRSIDQDEFVRIYESERPLPEHPLPKRLVAWAREKGFAIEFAEGKKGAILNVVSQGPSGRLRLAWLIHKGRLRIPMRHLKRCRPFDDPAMRSALQERLERFDGLLLTDAGMEGLPAIPTASLVDEAAIGELFSILEWMGASVQSAGE